MHPSQQREILIFIICIAASGLAGLIIGKALLSITAALLIYTILSLRNQFKLHNWIISRDGESIPEASGLWGQLFNEIYQIEKETGSNRARLTNILQRFQEAASALPDAMVILTKRNKIEWSNLAANKLLGINHPQDNGQPINNLIRHPKFDKYMRKNDFGKTITILSPNNPETQLTLQVIPFGSSQKLIICRDITHIMRLEEMRSHFVANVSHELRSPLTVLSGYLETLQDVKDLKKIRRALHTMHEQASRMERLVTDLLSLSKLETQPSDAHSNDVNVPAMLLELKDSAQFMSSNKSHAITLQQDEKLHLYGNRDELQSLFSNIINNAARYTPQNGSIKISWETKNDLAVFSVTDNGQGIPQKHIPHLTERFYRVDIDRSRETGGTGLGLAIVKHVLERHDGKLLIDSDLGKGSTFQCKFPAERILIKQPKCNLDLT
ncbi:MAG: phosphate regulon sensor histidine kinase PhoR [Gammaproteobacteria bacterium]|nr:phosphate regulon sensor histidine kinase PhoR [Gammaproteobacteria bacterium]